MNEVITALSETITNMNESLTKMHEINKRLTMAYIVTVICFAATIIAMVGFYFCADYGYMYQEVTDNQTVQQIGGSE